MSSLFLCRPCSDAIPIQIPLYTDVLPLLMPSLHRYPLYIDVLPMMSFLIPKLLSPYTDIYQRTFSCNQVSSQLFFLTKVLITFESVTVDLFYEFFLKDIATKVFLRRV